MSLIWSGAAGIPLSVTTLKTLAAARTGVAVDAVYPQQLTALMWAAGQGQVEATKLLLARGARTDLRDDRGLTAREIAAQAGHSAVVAVLDAAR